MQKNMPVKRMRSNNASLIGLVEDSNDTDYVNGDKFITGMGAIHGMDLTHR